MCRSYRRIRTVWNMDSLIGPQTRMTRVTTMPHGSKHLKEDTATRLNPSNMSWIRQNHQPRQSPLCQKVYTGSEWKSRILSTLKHKPMSQHLKPLKAFLTPMFSPIRNRQELPKTKTANGSADSPKQTILSMRNAPLNASILSALFLDGPPSNPT